MKTLDQLIQGFCPDGVEYKRIGDLFKRVKGTPITATQMKQIASNEGEIRIFAGGKTAINAHLKDIPNPNIIRVPAVLIQSRGVIDVIYYDKPFTFKNEMWAYTHENSTLLKFLFYILKTKILGLREKAISMGAFPQISIPDTEDIEIPVPPIEVQAKIVEILDKFTTLTAELQAELQARQQQYEYYRDRLLSFGALNNIHFDNDDEDSRAAHGSADERNKNTASHCKIMKMSDIGYFIRGNGLQKKDFSEEGIGCIHYGQIYTRLGTFTTKTLTKVPKKLADKLVKVSKGDIVITNTSENIEDVCKAVAWLGEEDIVIGGHACVFKHNQNPKYIAYWTQTKDFANQKRKVAQGVKVIDVKISDLEDFEVPIPPLSEQQRIVYILDRFEALTNDIKSGLPAEIAARQQQYEYYRDKLLTFKRIDA